MSSKLYDLAKGEVYLEGLNAKLERKEELSLAEKRFLLETGMLGYKALTFPESLTQAETNRILRMPPPDEVTANIKLVTNGAMSTPNEMFQAAVDDAEAMTTEELTLIKTLFKVTEVNIWQSSATIRWGRKLGKLGRLAVNTIAPGLLRDGFRAACRVLMDSESPRMVAKAAKALTESGPVDTPEQHAAHFERERRLQEKAAERACRWEEYDVKLFAEAAESMLKMAAELEGEVCECELCVAFYS